MTVTELPPILKPSRASEIDLEIRLLIAKIVAGTATDDDRREFLELSAQRSRMMRPIIPERIRQLRMSRRRRFG